MRVNIQYSKSKLRSFGLTVGGVFLLIGIWPFLRRGLNVRLWAVALGGALIVPGLVRPAILRRPYQFWMQLAHVLGWINTKIILSIMFYVLFTPAALILRWIGRDPMNRAFASDADTYRVLRQPRSATHMRHQF